MSGGILWANLHLLFWLSLVPFTTGWMGENSFSRYAVALYGVNLLMAAVSYFVLQVVIIRSHGNESVLARAIGSDLKGKMSLVLYTLAIICARWLPIAAGTIYFIVALIWLIPDTRIEKALRREE